MNKKSQRIATYIAILLLISFFALAVSSARLKSPTYDEEAYIARGYSYWKTGDLRLRVRHPLLINALSGLPLLLLSDLKLPTDHPSWHEARYTPFAEQFLWHYNDNADQIVFLARLPTVLLGVLLGVFVFKWASELYGWKAGLLALFLCAFDPNILAHSRLATTDLGLTCFTFIATYWFWRYLDSQTSRHLILAGVALGLAQASKFSALIFIPLLPLLIVVHHLTRVVPRLSLASVRAYLLTKETWRQLGKLAVGLLLILIVGFLTVWAIYGFEFGPMEGSSVSIPAPSHFGELQALFRRLNRTNYAFLMGQRSTQGWWYYFIVAFFIKTPLPTLILLLLAIVISLRGGRWRREVVLSIPPAFFFVVVLFTAINLGYRYVLPVLPFVFVFASKVALPNVQCPIRHSPFAARAGLAVLGIWYLASNVFIYPHYLAYFNELAGGPDNGYKYLVDSNLDWGQDLKGLKAYMDEHGLTKIKLSYFGSAHPSYYGISYEPLPCRSPLPLDDPNTRSFYPTNPAPGVYAISATNLQWVWLDMPDPYAWFRAQEPVDKIGYSIFIYNVPRVGQGAVNVCLSGLTIEDIDQETYAGFGTNDVRVKWFDAQNSLIVPAAGEATWYLVGERTPLDPDIGEWFLADAQLRGERYVANGAFQYSLYLLEAGGWGKEDLPLPDSSLPVWWSPEVEFLSGEKHSRHPLTVPVDFNHQVMFLGYELVDDQIAAGQEVRLTTYWRALQPIKLPLVIFVHLLDGHSTVWGSQDGLDVPPAGWEAGDVIIQKHCFPVNPDAAPGEYQLELGLYFPATMQRLVVFAGDEAVADRLLLHPVRIGE